MSRQQFMAELKQLLGDIPAAERDEALGFYEEYFNDAGEENEEQLIMQLESPEKVAKSIKAGLEYADDEEREFSETGFSGFYPKDKNEIINTIPDDTSRGFGRNGMDIRNNRLLLILAIIVLSPIIFPLLGSAFGIIVGIFGAIFGIMCALFFGGIGMIVGGIACIIASIPLLAASASASIIVAGVGFLLLALGFAFIWAGRKFTTVLVPTIWRFMHNLVKSLITGIRYRLRPTEI